MEAYLLFDLCALRCAVEARHVREVFLLPALTPVARTGGCLAGIVNLRGSVLPVLDLAPALGVARRRYRLSDSVVVLDAGTEPFGILVDRVAGVRSVSPEALQDAPGLVAAASTFPSASVIDVDGELALVASLDRLRELAAASVPPAEAGGTASVAAEGAGQPSLDRGAEDAGVAIDPQDAPVFRERAAALQRHAGSDEAEGGAPFAVVRLGEEYFGVGLDAIREFVVLPEVTRVPGCPENIVGVANLRGEILTIVDIRGSVGIPFAAPGPAGVRRALVAEAGGGRAGVLIDEVVDVIYTRPSSLAPLPPSLRAASSERLLGSVPLDRGTVGILDLPGILADERLRVRSGACSSLSGDP